MVNRWIGILSIFCMLSANAALVFHELVPDWLAGEPPEIDAMRLADEEERLTQVGIFDEYDRTVGRSWTIAKRTGELIKVQSWTVLLPVALPNGLSTPHCRIDTELNYQKQDQLDTLTVRIHWKGEGPAVSLKGEFMEPDDFPCEWEIGEQSGRFILRASATRALGEALRPFDRLPGLYVGRSWRLSLIDPLAEILPGRDSSSLGMNDVLVRVDREETIRHYGRDVETFHVIADRAQAWVSRDGRVLRQQVDVPLLGRLVLRDEPYDAELRSAMIQFRRSHR